MKALNEMIFGMGETATLGAAGAAAGLVVTAGSMPVALAAGSVVAAATGIFLIADRAKHGPAANHGTAVFRRPTFLVFVAGALILFSLGMGIKKCGEKAISAANAVRNGVHNFTAFRLAPAAV